MSADIGLLVKKLKSGKIQVKELCCSDGRAYNDLGTFKTAEEVFKFLENWYGTGYVESLVIEGFR